MLILGLSTAQAQHWPLFGTEDDPELLGEPGNVTYDPKYTGPRDHDYLDLLAGWFEYDNVTDQILFTMKVADAAPLEDGAQGRYVGCRVHGEVTLGEGNRGLLEFRWNQFPNGSISSGVSFQPADTNSGTQNTKEPVSHAFNSTLAEPGYFGYRVQRQDLLWFGDLFVDPVGACGESYDPLEQGGLTAIYRNSDGAQSEAEYSFVELRRTENRDGTPIDEPWQSPNSTATETSTDEGGESPAVGSATLVISAFLGLALSRISRGRDPPV